MKNQTRMWAESVNSLAWPAHHQGLLAAHIPSTVSPVPNPHYLKPGQAGIAGLPKRGSVLPVTNGDWSWGEGEGLTPSPEG